MFLASACFKKKNAATKVHSNRFGLNLEKYNGVFNYADTNVQTDKFL